MFPYRIFPAPLIGDGRSRNQDNIDNSWTSLSEVSIACKELTKCGCKHGCQKLCKCKESGFGGKCAALCHCKSKCDKWKFINRIMNKCNVPKIPAFLKNNKFVKKKLNKEKA